MKAEQPAPIPTIAIAVIYCKDGVDYPIRGYKLFTDDMELRTHLGRKTWGEVQSAPLRRGNQWVLRDGANRPIQIAPGLIAPIERGRKYYDFREVFG